jgi:hypothetical protein
MVKLLPPMLQVALLMVLVGCDSKTSADLAGKSSRPDKTAGASKGGSKIVGAWRFVRSSNNRDLDWGTKLDYTPERCARWRPRLRAQAEVASARRTDTRASATPSAMARRKSSQRKVTSLLVNTTLLTSSDKTPLA